MLAEAVEVAGAGAAGVDHRGDAALPCELVGVDPERGAAPIDVGVEVDQAGRDDLAGDVADVGSRPAVPADARDLAAGKSDIDDRIEILGWIDDAAVAQDEIVGDGEPPW
jgi:hypothetical protein